MNPRRTLVAVASILVVARTVFSSTRDDAASSKSANPAKSSPRATPPYRRAPRHCTTVEETPVAASEGRSAEIAEVKPVRKRVLRLLDGRGEPVSGVWAKGEHNSGF